MPTAVKNGCAWRLAYTHLDDVAKEIENLFQMLSSPKENIIDKLKLLPKLGQFASWMPKVKTGKGECQQVIMKDNPDITKLPVITCWPKDGGPFVTLPIIHTKDPVYQFTKCRHVPYAGFRPDANGYALA